MNATPAYVTVHDFRAAAHALLDDTAQRYRLMSETMTSLSKHDTADAFRRLDAMESETLRSIFGSMTCPDTKITGSKLDATSEKWFVGDDNAQSGKIADSIYSLTPVRAINLALENSKRTMRFLVDVLSQTPNAEICVLADRLYHLLLTQMACLRAARLRAHRQRIKSSLELDLEHLLKIKKGMKLYRQHRDICLGRLREQLIRIARIAPERQQDRILSLVSAVPISKSISPLPEARIKNLVIEGNAATQAIASVETVFDALLFVAQHSGEELLFRAAQKDANLLLPMMRQSRDLLDDEI
jgi:hypothetical protein